MKLKQQLSSKIKRETFTLKSKSYSFNVIYVFIVISNSMVQLDNNTSPYLHVDTYPDF